jgi:hypothetical protein
VNAYIAYALKAIGTAIASFVGGVIVALSDSSITWQEWVISAGWAILAGLAVFGIRNGPNPQASRTIGGTSVTYEPENGHHAEH